ncbi:MAG: (2Fe-2S)-binding protein [Bdellovibrionales bacterium]
MKRNQKKRSPIVCLCNAVSQERIEDTIRDGIEGIDEIYDKTSAGVGPCGGSCRPFIQKMIDQYEEDGTFPEVARPLHRRRK